MKARSLAGKTSFLKKLSGFFILFLSVLTTNAQIVYTDVVPDAIISGSGSYSLDLNNDGAGNFTLTVGSGITHCGFYEGHESSADATSEGESKIAKSGNYPTALHELEVIDNSLTWSGFSYQILRFVESGTFSFCNLSYGNWSGLNDHYLGLKMVSSGKTYYGWARLSVNVSAFAASITIKDYAFNSNPDSSILAGQTCPPQAVITAIGATTFCAGDSVILSSSNAGTNLSYKWKLNGNSIAGATNKNYTAKTAGKYKVKVTDNTDSCSTLSDKMKVTVPCRMNNGIETTNTNDALKVYPNPFSPDQSGSTTISFSLPQSQNVSLKIFDLTGRLVTTLLDETISEGNHQLQWNARDENGNAVSEGIYFLKMQTANEAETIRLNVVR